MRMLAYILVCCALFWQGVQTSLAEEAEAGQDGALWTAIIPDAFPRHVYTWHLLADGSYREDGREAATGRPIQSTLSGRWQRNGARMLLQQNDQTFVFDGAILGHIYVGTLYFRQRAISHFCAAEGEKPPLNCGAGPGVAAAAPGH
jgi:hypothetical protein